VSRIRTVYLVRENGATPEAVRPQVFIETTAAGKLTYGVRVSGRSLKRARLAAQGEFARLRAFVEAKP
jgi:hypothetical protein